MQEGTIRIDRGARNSRFKSQSLMQYSGVLIDRSVKCHASELTTLCKKLHYHGEIVCKGRAWELGV